MFDQGRGRTGICRMFSRIPDSYSLRASISLSHTHTVTHTLNVCVLSHVWLFAIPWTVAHQASPSMEFSSQEYWSGLLFRTPGNLPRDWTCVSWVSCQMSSGSQIAPVEKPVVSSSKAAATFSFPLWFLVSRTCLALWTRQNFAWRDEKRLCVRELLDFDFEEWGGIIYMSAVSCITFCHHGDTLYT